MIEVAISVCRRGFLGTLFRIANIYSQLQHVCYKAHSFNYKFLNYFFYIFENIIAIFIFLDFLLLKIGESFMYLFLSFLPLLVYLYFIVTVIFYNIIYTSKFSTNFTILHSHLETLISLKRHSV